MSANDGGSAFPQNIAHSPLGDVVTADMYFTDKGGMALRDYFAAKAMADLCADPTIGNNGWDCSKAAKVSYELADAMLAERQKEQAK